MPNIFFKKPDKTSLQAKLSHGYLILILYISDTSAIMLDCLENIPNERLYEEFSSYLPSEELLEETVYHREYYMDQRVGRLFLYSENSEELYEHIVARILEDPTITVIWLWHT